MGIEPAVAVGRTVRELLPAIEPEWIETYGDSNGDGLIDYARRDKRGLVKTGRSLLNSRKPSWPW